MNLKLNKLFIGFLSIVVIFSCKKDDVIKSYESVKIKQIIIQSIGSVESITFHYDENNLLIRGNHSGSTYFINDYDDLNRLIQTNRYNSSGLYHYFTFQYDSNTITRMRYQYYPSSDSWGGDNEKTGYCYNSQNNCERIDYYRKDDNANWIKLEEYTICTWSNDNLIELKHYNGDILDYTETYQYDDKSNPERLLNYMISPWTKSKNNMISCSKQYTDGRQTSATYKYSYNEYGYPTEKVRIDEVGTTTEKYEYEFE